MKASRFSSIRNFMPDEFSTTLKYSKKSFKFYTRPLMSYSGWKQITGSSWLVWEIRSCFERIKLSKAWEHSDFFCTKLCFPLLRVEFLAREEKFFLWEGWSWGGSQNNPHSIFEKISENFSLAQNLEFGSGIELSSKWLLLKPMTVFHYFIWNIDLKCSESIL